MALAKEDERIDKGLDKAVMSILVYSHDLPPESPPLRRHVFTRGSVGIRLQVPWSYARLISRYSRETHVAREQVNEVQDIVRLRGLGR